MFGGVPNAALGGGYDAAERLNSQGYRGRAASKPKPAGELRVVVLGGSAVFEGEPALPELLERELHERGIAQAACFNFGVVSSVSGMEVARLLFEVTELEPDVVVLYDGGNDLLLPAVYDPRPGYPFNFVVYESNPLLRRNLATYPSLALFAYGSQLLRTLMPGWFERRFVDVEGLRRRVGYGSEEWKANIAATYAKNLVRADRVTRAWGSDFVAFFRPLVFYKPTLGPAESAIRQRNEQLYPLLVDLRARVQEALVPVREREGVVIYDLSGVFDTTTTDMFVDVVHTTAEGKQVVARAIALELARRPSLGSPKPGSFTRPCDLPSE
jgi:lysophospholipase L1-like esterase